MRNKNIKFFEIEYNYKDNSTAEKMTAIVTDAEYNWNIFMDTDDEIFHYGMDEEYLKILVELGNSGFNDFIVYSYKEIVSVLEDTKKAILDYWSPKNESVITPSGFRYRDTKSAVTNTKEIEDKTDEGLFEQFYKLNNSLRYCNGCYYKFQDKQLADNYAHWLKSPDYKAKSFNLYYGNGVVD